MIGPDAGRSVVVALGRAGRARVDDTAVDRLISEGRDLIRDFSFCGHGGSGPLPWEVIESPERRPPHGTASI